MRLVILTPQARPNRCRVADLYYPMLYQIRSHLRNASSDTAPKPDSLYELLTLVHVDFGNGDIPPQVAPSVQFASPKVSGRSRPPANRGRDYVSPHDSDACAYPDRARDIWLSVPCVPFYRITSEIQTTYFGGGYCS